jgi:hypothetical protein
MYILFSAPNVIIQKKPKHHVIREFIPKVPQGKHFIRFE